MTTNQTKTASVPPDWYKKSPFCAAFIESCLQLDRRGDRLVSEITKTAADRSVALEWIRFFKQL